MFDERQVVSSIIKGDFRAFEELVKQYERLVFFVINRLVHEQEDQEDVCQEVFIKLHKSLPAFRFQSKLSTWIARIAYLTAVDYLKKTKKAQNGGFPDDIDNYHFTNETPEQILNKKEMAAYIDQLISQLPEKYRTVLTLYHLNEFSYPEIGEITGMPEGTVKNYLFRARKMLKEKIQAYFKSEMI